MSEISQNENESTLLSIHRLTTKIKVDSHYQSIISNIDFKIKKGQTFCLLGESGSGKSITALSILRLLQPKMVHSLESQILLHNLDLLSLTEKEMRKIRCGRISMIFQEPQTSLNPVLSIKYQIGEALLKHRNINRNELKNEIIALLVAVKISDPNRVYESYPHQLSGGMKQRVMIAMALAGRPELLIADEPTTALDVTTQAQILRLLKELQAEFNMSILFITHDLGVAAFIADEIGVMCCGELVETGKPEIILKTPKHPYTQELIKAQPQLQINEVSNEAEWMLQLENVKVFFPIKKGFFKRTVGHIHAVDNVTFAIKEGETLALVGESGCGKTTLAKAILSLVPTNGGNIVVLGDSLSRLSRSRLLKKRSEYQIIFQDPFSAMDPRMLVKDILEEGMLALGIGTDKVERLSRMDVLLEQVGLKPEHKYRYPHEFSGGQRQRICIARALAVGPRLIICDEPTSSLDRSYQAQIIDLLIYFQQEFDLSYLFITHNFSVVRALAHRVAVMKEGKIVEEGKTEVVLGSPQHPYTRALLDAVLSA